MVRTAINGFGRIGRVALRVALTKYQDKVKIVAINTSCSMDVKGWAHLFQYDSVYGQFKGKMKIEKGKKEEIGRLIINHQKIPFLEFLGNVKDIIYSKNVFDFILKNAVEDWDLWCYLKFLEKEKIIKVKRTGKASVLKKEIFNIIPQPQSEEEIKDKIEKRLKTKIKREKPVTSLFEKLQDFVVKAKWDQMPISTGSAIFLVKKILDNLPLNKKFLSIGDDDFISVILSLAEPRIESLVIDADEKLLSCIDDLSSKFNSKIETKKVDIRKEKLLGEKFIGASGKLIQKGFVERSRKKVHISAFPGFKYLKTLKILSGDLK